MYTPLALATDKNEGERKNSKHDMTKRRVRRLRRYQLNHRRDRCLTRAFFTVRCPRSTEFAHIRHFGQRLEPRHRTIGRDGCIKGPRSYHAWLLLILCMITSNSHPPASMNSIHARTSSEIWLILPLAGAFSCLRLLRFSQLVNNRQVGAARERWFAASTFCFFVHSHPPIGSTCA